MNAPPSPLTAELDAALQWWRMAGVDCDFTDDATDWLAAKAPAQVVSKGAAGSAGPNKSAASATAPQPEATGKTVERRDLLGESPPSSLEAFREWWLEAPGLDAIGPRGRVPARGRAGAAIMVLVVDPEQEDSERLLSGPQGRLLANILSAMGVDDEQTYIASALPRHTPMADTASIAAGGMDAVTLHHVGLVSPQKLLIFGAGVLPLIGRDVSEPYQSLREINHASSKVPLLMSEGLDSLMAMPRLKARFWRRWMEWSPGYV